MKTNPFEFPRSKDRGSINNYIKPRSEASKAVVFLNFLFAFTSPRDHSEDHRIPMKARILHPRCTCNLPFRAINTTCCSFIYMIICWECFVGSRRIYANEIETSPSRWVVRFTDWEPTACLINDTVSPYREHTLRIVAESLITRNVRVSSTDEELTLARSNFLALVACPKCAAQWNKIYDHEWVVQWRLYAQKRATGVC